MLRSAPAHACAAIRFRLGITVRAFLLVDQGLTIGNRDLIVIGVDFAEGQKAVAVAAVIDEGGLQ